MRRNDLRKILIIGSGPIVIGQAAEFDYAGTQACLALKEEGYEIILVNSNPATIMTDAKMADKIYMEPLTIDYLAKIIRKERPHAIIPGLGGQTGLNLTMTLAEKGILEECRVEILGTSLQTIKKAEDRELFKKLCEEIGEPIIKSYSATSLEEAINGANKIGYPLIIRPAFTLGGSGGGFADNEEQLKEIALNGLKLSPVKQILIEKSVYGYQEIEYEVIRDKTDKAIVVCDMENIDPVGIHTGDSMVVAPIMTLNDQQKITLKKAALKIIKALQIEGGCNVQFALKPNTCEYYLIEVNPRVSRSSALASKATGYPIAKISSKIALGYTLDELIVGNKKADVEPKVNYIVFKMARFPFDKFMHADRFLTTQMKATGEIMAIGSTFEEALMKGINSLESKNYHLYNDKFTNNSTAELLKRIQKADDERLFIIGELLNRGVSSQEISNLTMIVKEFIDKMNNIILFEKKLYQKEFDKELIIEAKRYGFSDIELAKIFNKNELEIIKYRLENNILPSFKMVDAVIDQNGSLNYFYSTYHGINQSISSLNKKYLIIGSGSIRIGQGIEFDYSSVHAIWSLQELGYEAIIVNSNPETVSTDYTIADKLYFEPLTLEYIINIINFEKPAGVIIQFGGQTAINLADKLNQLGIKIIGTSKQAIDLAENKKHFRGLLKTLNIPQPFGETIMRLEDGLEVTKRIGYPVIIRPSYILGGQAMQIIHDDEQLIKYLSTAVLVNKEQPVLIDKYIIGKEVEVDAICDGKEVLIPGIMEHIEKTGIHSGDSISIYPSYSLSNKVKELIVKYTIELGLKIGIIGLYNIQFIVDKEEKVYIIEVNPRASRTVPFLSKITKINIASLATKIMVGNTLSSLGYSHGLMIEKKDRYYVKTPTFSFNKIKGLDALLGPEMKSTGEAIGYDVSIEKALYKSLQAANMVISNYGTVFFTVSDYDKEDIILIAKRFFELGFNIVATQGTALFLKSKGIKVKILNKISQGSQDIIDWIKSGRIKYIVNTMSYYNAATANDGFIIRREAVDNNIPVLTSLDTVKVLLDVLESITLKVGVINDN